MARKHTEVCPAKWLHCLMARSMERVSRAGAGAPPHPDCGQEITDAQRTVDTASL